MKADAGRVFSDAGYVFDGNSLSPAGSISIAQPGAFEPDSGANRVFYLESVGSNTWKVRVFDWQTLTQLHEVFVRYVIGTPSHLTRWGDDGIAFRTSAGQLFILRIPFTVIDADSDGMADNWETEYFGSTTAINGGAQQDFDADGVTNLQEFLNGTDPTDAQDVLRIKKVSRISDTGKIELHFHGVLWRRYQVERAVGIDGPWSSVGPILYGRGITTNAPILPLPDSGSEFYRVRLIR